MSSDSELSELSGSRASEPPGSGRPPGGLGY